MLTMVRVIRFCATTLVTLGLMAFAPAHAAVDHRAQALPTREITLAFKDAGIPMVKLHGRAEQYAGHRVLIQRRYGHDWRTVKKTECDDTSRYAAGVEVPATGKKYSFRVKTPRTKKFATSYSQTVVLFWQ
jgi:hypothetical protein